MKDKIKNENYIMISGWMIKELNLKGSELLVYAIIYGFSQDGINKYEGSRQYLADWCNCTKQGIDRALKNLLKKKLITKEEKVINNIKFCCYQSTKFTTPVNKVGYPSKQSLHNNIENNIEYILNKRKLEKEIEISSYDWTKNF